MAENTMKLEVITPERSFYTGDVTFVELNTTEGEVGIYARHIPMTMIIAPGVLTITEEDGTKKKALAIYEKITPFPMILCDGSEP